VSSLATMSKWFKKAHNKQQLNIPESDCLERWQLDADRLFLLTVDRQWKMSASSIHLKKDWQGDFVDYGKSMPRLRRADQSHFSCKPSSTLSNEHNA
jgi:hypothetical protein